MDNRITLVARYTDRNDVVIEGITKVDSGPSYYRFSDHRPQFNGLIRRIPDRHTETRLWN